MSHPIICVNHSLQCANNFVFIFVMLLCVSSNKQKRLTTFKTFITFFNCSIHYTMPKWSQQFCCIIDLTIKCFPHHLCFMRLLNILIYCKACGIISISISTLKKCETYIFYTFPLSLLLGLRFETLWIV